MDFKINSVVKIIGNALEKFTLWSSLVLFVVLILINIYEICIRTFYGFSLIWIQEFSSLIITGVVFLGGCVVYRRKKDPSLKFLIDRFFSQKNKKIMHTVFNLFTISFLLVVLIYTYKFQFITAKAISTYLRITMNWFSFPVIVYAIITIFFVIEDTWDTWNNSQ